MIGRPEIAETGNFYALNRKRLSFMRSQKITSFKSTQRQGTMPINSHRFVVPKMQQSTRRMSLFGTGIAEPNTSKGVKEARHNQTMAFN
mmetsp:Transcript_33508/g.51478  ORF Transcript_33508/g.51478 Transcript_33508/m.51478 type:complete len:89 (+) Transcript_33508:959-1225(+)